MADEYIALGHAGLSGVTVTLLRNNEGAIPFADNYNTGASVTRQVGWSPDGQYLACAHIAQASGFNFTLLDHTTPGQLTLAATYAVGSQQGVAFAPNGQFILTSGGVATLLDASTPGAVAFLDSYDVSGNGTAVSWTPDSNYVAVMNTSGGVTLLHRDGGSLVLADTYAAGALRLKFSPNGAYLACVNSGTSPQFFLLHHSNGQLTFSDSYVLAGSGLACDWSPDGRYIAIKGATNDPKFTLLQQVNGALSLADTYNAVDGSVGLGGVAFNSDGLYICRGGSISTQYVLLLSHSGGTVAFSAVYNTTRAIETIEFTPGESAGAVFSGAGAAARMLL